jgi:hypothetical protein
MADTLKAAALDDAEQLLAEYYMLDPGCASDQLALFHILTALRHYAHACGLDWGQAVSASRDAWEQEEAEDAVCEEEA